MNPGELPLSIKTDLVAISQRLPNARDRRRFCVNAGRRIGELAQEFVVKYKYTIFYGVVGAILGCILKNGIKNIWGIGWVLGPIVDSFPVLFGLGGAAKGFIDDCDNAVLKRKILRIVQEELNRAAAQPR